MDTLQIRGLEIALAEWGARQLAARLARADTMQRQLAGEQPQMATAVTTFAERLARIDRDTVEVTVNHLGRGLPPGHIAARTGQVEIKITGQIDGVTTTALLERGTITLDEVLLEIATLP
jgi:hypothetical protein